MESIGRHSMLIRRRAEKRNGERGKKRTGINRRTASKKVRDRSRVRAPLFVVKNFAQQQSRGIHRFESCRFALGHVRFSLKSKLPRASSNVFIYHLAAEGIKENRVVWQWRECEKRTRVKSEYRSHVKSFMWLKLILFTSPFSESERSRCR